MILLSRKKLEISSEICVQLFAPMLPRWAECRKVHFSGKCHWNCLNTPEWMHQRANRTTRFTEVKHAKKEFIWNKEEIQQTKSEMILHWAHRLLCEPHVTSGTSQNGERKIDLSKRIFWTLCRVFFLSIDNFIWKCAFSTVSFLLFSHCVCCMFAAVWHSAKGVYSKWSVLGEWDWMDCAWSTHLLTFVMNRFPFIHWQQVQRTGARALIFHPMMCRHEVNSLALMMPLDSYSVSWRSFVSTQSIQIGYVNIDFIACASSESRCW